METTRQQKFARLIQKELSAIFMKQGANYFGKAFVTITHVKTTPDLSIVRVNLSVLGTKEREDVVTRLNDSSREIRGILGASVKHQVRHIPQLEFFLDDSLDYAENIERIFKEINSDPSSKKD